MPPAVFFAAYPCRSPPHALTSTEPMNLPICEYLAVLRDHPPMQAMITRLEANSLVSLPRVNTLSMCCYTLLHVLNCNELPLCEAPCLAQAHCWEAVGLSETASVHREIDRRCIRTVQQSHVPTILPVHKLASGWVFNSKMLAHVHVEGTQRAPNVAGGEGAYLCIPVCQNALPNMAAKRHV